MPDETSDTEQMSNEQATEIAQVVLSSLAKAIHDKNQEEIDSIFQDYADLLLQLDTHDLGTLLLVTTERGASMLNQLVNETDFMEQHGIPRDKD
jgi:hypothetical protein